MVVTADGIGIFSGAIRHVQCGVRAEGVGFGLDGG